MEGRRNKAGGNGEWRGKRKEEGKTTGRRKCGEKGREGGGE
jgi:hypothetical protein